MSPATTRTPLGSARFPHAVQFQTRAEVSMDAIERYILTHNLQPGDPLPTEGSLCEDLGVSRSSVREALRKLEALEIVKVQQGKGAFVGDMTMRPLIKSVLLRASVAPDSVEALRQVVGVRIVLDRGMANEIVAAMRDVNDPELHTLIDIMVDKARKGRTFMDEDIAFHTALVSRINNPLAEQLMNAMWMVHMSALPSVTGTNEHLVDTALAHRKLLEAAEAGNAEAYLHAVDAHYAPLMHALDITK
ncbi:FadR/GntR family transcriptional regulator [Schaalia suimastitidis]|uniref:FadR/GntR family transcriptional regulator n=1 Tax=Schaalia suimastitidis TaxID=121163 RepID=UPI00041E155C|nr:GntR family transcriptional regulator [Schaalia suimastitidis]